ncbi:LOW QUALITY PROTEIN: sentrin-specific protease 1-like [Drosophila serrata]|uniref:LOW QUALITY PROTEIN: sentrin-specific protease 1-like n=1 Tax=Drosophila serrata TaxID=7274 RepID=UPI000A1D0D0C|nr:LOW QUALITY PROTEIN: sentrin-specific protease 1-like [Drosophila serrata]
MTQLNNLINGNPHQVVSSKFNLQTCSSWLNDEVINFYMNLLTERSEKRSGELPSVYQRMNTFFVPRLLQNGHAGVKRWTRKVDIFSKDIIPVPVHCKTIRYCDSMGKPNQDVLDALESYLQQESLDKRKQPFDTSDFKIESVPNVPQQTNGSDCGVFSCMFAEYISPDAPITFSQENMDYFRKKMILEISDGKLWN